MGAYVRRGGRRRSSDSAEAQAGWNDRSAQDPGPQRRTSSEKPEHEKEALKRVYGVKSLGVFGSWARGEATAASDLDLLVEFDALSFDR